MFKKQDNMRPGSTPERVLAICRLVEKDTYTQDRLYQLCELTATREESEPIRDSIEDAEVLGLIQNKKEEGYVLKVSSDALNSAQAFRRAIAPIIFKNNDTTFFKLTEWFIANAQTVMKLNSFDDMAAEASKAGVQSITENGVLGWRFWMRYLGLAYQYNGTLIPNMCVRMEDAWSGIKSGTSMSGAKFMSWVRENLPESVSACTNNTIPLAISNGLRSLAGEGKIELKMTPDAASIKMQRMEGVEMNEFSEVTIKELA